jgi:hypothetical protein
MIRLRELAALSEYDYYGDVTDHDAMAIIEGFLLCSTLLLTAKGCCIVRDTLSKSELARSLAFSLVFITFSHLLMSETRHGLQLYIYIIGSLVSFVVFVIELVLSINRASLHILAHLLVIANAGIAPETTPVYAKHRLYERFEYSVVIFSILFSVRMACSLLFHPEYWLDEYLADLIKVGIYGTLAVLFRLRGSESGDFVPLGDSGMELPLADLELLSIESQELQRGGMKWEEGMALPGVPVIVEQPSFVTLTSPDGTTQGLVFTEELMTKR